MCGIFAYSGQEQVTSNLMKGLKKLEYRGYDSSGIAFFSSDFKSIHSLRASGDLSELEKLVSQKNTQGSLGIGHTRWATHGSPTVQNAHPHKAGVFYLVHNGVIENEEELKPFIPISDLVSETDTEIIVHLLFYFYKKNNKDLIKSLYQTMESLKGSYAIVFISEDHPGEMFGFKKGPPLLICKTQDELFISSDVQSMDPRIDQVCFLEDGDVVHVKGQEFIIYDKNQKKVERKFKQVKRDKNSAEKKDFPHFMIKEIFEQPQVAHHILDYYLDKNKQRLDFKFNKGSKASFEDLILSHSKILVLGCGSSYFAGLFAKYIIEDLAQVKTEVEIASEFIYRKTCVDKKTLVLCISQSGETADLLTAVKKAKDQGLVTCSLCNNSESSLSRLSDFSFLMQAGQEVAVASTKAFSSSLLVVILLALEMARIKKIKTLDEQSWVKNLLRLPAYMEDVLKYNRFFLKTASELKKFSGFVYLGRELYYPIALEGALKLKEVAYVHAEGLASGELKHGPLALIDKNYAAVVLLPKDELLYKKTLTNLKEVRSRGASIICLGGSDELDSLCTHRLALPDAERCLRPLLALIPLQIMAYYISRSRGYDADKPRNLAKSVTVE